MARGRRLRYILYEGIRSPFCPSFTMLSHVIILIVNGNILTNGRKYKKIRSNLNVKVYINLNKLQTFQ